MNDFSSDYPQLIEDCMARESQLSDWERGFLDSISKQLERETQLSIRQAEILTDMWDRVTSNG